MYDSTGKSFNIFLGILILAVFVGTKTAFQFYRGNSELAAFLAKCSDEVIYENNLPIDRQLKHKIDYNCIVCEILRCWFSPYLFNFILYYDLLMFIVNVKMGSHIRLANDGHISPAKDTNFTKTYQSVIYQLLQKSIELSPVTPFFTSFSIRERDSICSFFYIKHFICFDIPLLESFETSYFFLFEIGQKWELLCMKLLTELVSKSKNQKVKSGS